MSSIKVRQLVNPSPAELDKCAEVLAKAFQDDHFTKVCVGDMSLNFAFQRATIAAIALRSEVYVATYGDSDVVGVAGWFGPGTGLLDTPEQHAAGFDAFFASLTPELGKWWMEYFLPKYSTFATGALGEGTKLDAWHLQVFGVLPEYQGKGVGKALIRVNEETAKAAGLKVCLEAAGNLETPENPIAPNVKLYQHLGYVVKGSEPFDSSIGGFQYYCMLKD